MKIGRRLLAMALALSGCTATAPTVTVTAAPIVLTSSADFGCLRSGSATVSRLIRIRNSSVAKLHVARWAVSCDCLSAEPATIDLPAEASIYVRLMFDPTKESDNFVGDLRISVEGFGAHGERLAMFDVPVSVIAPENLQHLAKNL